MDGVFKKVWFLEVYNGRRGVPEDVRRNVQKLWGDLCLGNDTFFHRATVDWLEESGYDVLAKYIKEHLPGISTDEEVHINFWW